MIFKDAHLSTGNTRRWTLTRIWDKSKPLVNWVMLNPSTADHKNDDPTIRKCVGFTKLLGYSYGGLVVTNLFDLRSTDPQHLKTHPDPCSQYNAHYVYLTAKQSGKIVLAWGNHGTFRGQDKLYKQFFEEMKSKVICLGRNVNGTPKHPLMVAYATPFEEFFK